MKDEPKPSFNQVPLFVSHTLTSDTGPKTEAGRLRCAEAKTLHGRETREARAKRSLASARLAVLEEVGFALGFMSGGRTRGRRPDQMSEVYPELQETVGLVHSSKKNFAKITSIF